MEKPSASKPKPDSELGPRTKFVIPARNSIANGIKLKPPAENKSQGNEKQLDDKVTNPLEGQDMVDSKFQTPEHLRVAKEQKVKIVTLPNGAQLTFGEIIALAGDYYGIPEAPIANLQGNDKVDSGSRERFMAAYYSLAIAPYEEIKEQLEKLLTMINEEIKDETTVDGRRMSCKQKYSNQEWDEATGGMWLAGVPIVQGRMMKLAERNYDHFQPQAKEVYLIGHQLALEKAREAGKSRADEKEKKLDEAYSLDGFAGHFLTDCFSTGHIRVPRVELPKRTTPARVGHLLSRFMHEEDGEFGLRVTNIRGDKWIAYGDGMLMKECSKKNLELVTEIVQKSVNQVHQVFLNPKATLPHSSVVTDLLPFVDMKEKNNSPLFQVKDGKLHRRSDINNLQDTKTVSNWWRITTAVNLQFYKPKNSAI